MKGSLSIQLQSGGTVTFDFDVPIGIKDPAFKLTIDLIAQMLSYAEVRHFGANATKGKQEAA